MDADLELQGLIVGVLKANPAVVALVGQRIYDTVPLGAQFPYVSYGPSDSISDDADCIVGFDVFIQIDAWSRAVGFPEVKRISDAVRDALHDQPLSLTVNALVFLEHRQTRTLRDPDGLTSHAAISLQANVERRPAPVFPLKGTSPWPNLQPLSSANSASFSARPAGQSRLLQSPRSPTRTTRS